MEVLVLVNVSPTSIVRKVKFSVSFLPPSSQILTMATPHSNAVLKSQEQHGSVFQQLENYAWGSDPEFQSGLQAILGSSPSPEQAEHLTLRARCFYFARYGILYASIWVFEN